MKRNALLLIALLGLMLAGCFELRLDGEVTASESETQSVIVNDVPSLDVGNFAGTITVREGEPGRVTANLVRRSRLADEAAARAELETVTMAITQTNDQVSVMVDGGRNTDNVDAGVTAELELIVPPGSDLVLSLGAGDVTVTQPQGDVKINLGAGNATVELPAEASFDLAVTGGALSINSDFEGVGEGGLAADIDTTIGSAPAQTLNLNVGAGEVNLLAR
jgi:hypothetical protein